MDRGSERTHHRPGRLAPVAGFELTLELVQRGEPIALHLVAENVHQPGEPVDGAEMRPETARKEDGGNREVLGARSAGDGSHIHGVQDPLREAAGQHMAVALWAEQVV